MGFPFFSYIIICHLGLVLTVSQQLLPQTFSHITDSSANLRNPIHNHFSPGPLGRFSKPFIGCCLIFLHKQKTELVLFLILIVLEKMKVDLTHRDAWLSTKTHVRSPCCVLRTLEKDKEEQASVQK